MWSWWKQYQARRVQKDQLHRLERAELQAAVNKLDRARNNVEELVRRMLEELDA